MDQKLLAKYDELNNIVDNLTSLKILSKSTLQDTVEDILIAAYMGGYQVSEAMLQTKGEILADKLRESVYRKIDGKTFIDRIKEYESTNDVEAIKRVAETELHRVWNEASIDCASECGFKVNKTWVTQNDDKVRDTHEFLESVSVPLEEKFYTFDGDSALYPGGFEKAENNINCRCVLEFTPQGDIQ